MGIAQNLSNLRQLIPSQVSIIAVSKTKPASCILEAYNAGQRKFGENKAQELAIKHNELPKDIEWHFIGHLQKNKVKLISPFVRLIHSVDSLPILLEINKEAEKNHRIIDCLLQFHISKEMTKFGLNFQEAGDLLNSPSYTKLSGIRITGVMGMSSFSDDLQLIRQEFHTLKQYFDLLRSGFFKNSEDFNEISMGMSGDFQIAIEEGSTMVRIGTTIFGERH
ncbi:MAG: YggS family pyridoxal phosphate-dependent enzyme [Bacteroidales bacterium]|nr:YggS family pyridoxal phosphate-dependent enzyme [Bacteroidales bacterium]MDD4603309.1 YggS family pyridoxal phosphate-dependent enzyme [Bacteroidales bacterium]